MDRKAWLEELLGEELVAVRVRLREPDVVFVKGILEASEGLAAMFAEPRGDPSDARDRARSPQPRDGGAVVIAAPRSRSEELSEIIEDLRMELGGAVWDDPAPR